MEQKEIEIPELNGETNHTAKVRRLFAANADRTLCPKDVRGAFDCIPDAYVGPMLARLRDNGEIIRVAYGKYRAANGHLPHEQEERRCDIRISWVESLERGRVVAGTEDGRLFVARHFDEIEL